MAKIKISVIPEAYELSHILHQWQERYALLPLVRVSAACCAAETRLRKMVQDLSYSN